MSPAATLRAAATKLRETASKATPGPWEHASTAADGIMPRWIIGPPTDANDPWSAADVIAITGEVAECIDYITEPDGLIGDGDMEWIALMSPAVAEPLAAWLEDEAEGMTIFDPAEHEHIFSHPLAFARAILGRQS